MFELSPSRLSCALGLCIFGDNLCVCFYICWSINSLVNDNKCVLPRISSPPDGDTSDTGSDLPVSQPTPCIQIVAHGITLCTSGCADAYYFNKNTLK